MNEDAAISGVLGAILGFLANWFANRKKRGTALKSYEGAKVEVEKFREDLQAANAKLDELAAEREKQDTEIAKLNTALASALAKLDEDFKPGDENAKELADLVNAGPGPDVSDA
ncbi:MAG TPA: hypothetical protein VFH61_00620 [Thermoleophilia bacterium]|nr:hypothetical protein [Thermoleophilia bacterium]